MRFHVTGPLRYTLTAREAIELCRLIRPRTVIPIHYEGWSHFREGRAAIERELAAAPDVPGALAADRQAGRAQYQRIRGIGRPGGGVGRRRRVMRLLSMDCILVHIFLGSKFPGRKFM